MENNESELIEIIGSENMGEELRCKVLSRNKIRGQVTFEYTSNDLFFGIHIQRVYVFPDLGLVYRDEKHYENVEHFEREGPNDAGIELADLIGGAFDVMYFGPSDHGGSEHHYILKPSTELREALNYH